MDQIRETLGRIGELTDEELEQLSNDIVAEFESAESQDLSADIVDAMTELASAIDTVRSEKTRREEEAAELSRRRDEATARVKGATETTEDAEEDTATEDVEAESTEVPEEAKAAAVSTPAETESNKAAELSSSEDKSQPSSNADAEFGTAYEDDQEQRKAAGREVDEEFKHDETGPTTGVSKEVAQPEGDEDDGFKPSSARPEEAGEGYSSGDADEKIDELKGNDPASGNVESDNSNVPGVVADNSSDDTNNDDNGEETEPVTASAGEGVQPPASHRPNKVTERATVAITAGADIPGVTAGSELPNMRAIAEAMAQRMHGMRRTSGGDGEQHTVATLVASYPEDRTLRAGEAESNKEKIDGVASPEAITAAGGFCAPVEVSYEVFGFGTTGRPVKDALATFNADRGGIRWTAAPVLGDLNGAVSTWTLQDDIDAATPGAPDPTKPCLRVVCGAESTAYIDAIPLCLTFGNLQTRAFPEQVQANNDLALVTFARYAEQRLLTRIGALSTAVTAARYLGAARDFFNQVDRAAVAYRSRHRMDENDALRVIAPTWLKNMIRADLVNNMPGDGRDGNFELADSKINAWFRVRDINVSWTIDGESGQIFGAQGAGALLAYPSTVIWYLFAEGTFLFLDGGTLDLGLVRDSTLNATNDYKMFVETFEGVAKRGIEALRVTSTIEPNGAVAGTVDTYTGTDPGA